MLIAGSGGACWSKSGWTIWILDYLRRGFEFESGCGGASAWAQEPFKLFTDRQKLKELEEMARGIDSKKGANRERLSGMFSHQHLVRRRVILIPQVSISNATVYCQQPGPSEAVNL
jgi:hypothetical protein